MAPPQTSAISPRIPVQRPTPTSAAPLGERFAAVRAFSHKLTETLAVEDFVIQSMPDASPTRWHLAHSTWFFETFVLAKADANYEPFHDDFVYLFNSYYNAVGDQFPRPQRGLLSRPTVEQVFAYRACIDERMARLLETPGALDPALVGVIEVGLQHEQQHQELILTDLKHMFSCNPLHPVYRERKVSAGEPPPMDWIPFDEGLRRIGHDGEGFGYDNERPRHQEFVHAFELASRLVTNGEYLEFMRDGGYARPELWLSDGWATVKERGWAAPMYWQEIDGAWFNFTLSGLRPVNPNEPVCHVSYFEADAFAKWKGCWLPTEAAWETAAETVEIAGNFAECERFHTAPAESGDDALLQMFGDAWEWTCSQYVGYPGYSPPPGAIGEYNGKFMCNQFVLRGGSCATSRSHIRATYRNFFPADARWQFATIRLSRAPR